MGDKWKEFVFIQDPSLTYFNVSNLPYCLVYISHDSLTVFTWNPNGAPCFYLEFGLKKIEGFLAPPQKTSPASTDPWVSPATPKRPKVMHTFCLSKTKKTKRVSKEGGMTTRWAQKL